jgi:hypothetical protein
MFILRSRKIQTLFFRLASTSASMLTCRRRAADTQQTVTQTLPQTLVEQEGFWSVSLVWDVRNILQDERVVKSPLFWVYLIL